MADATSKRNVTQPQPVTRPVVVKPQASASKAARSNAVQSAQQRVAMPRATVRSVAEQPAPSNLDKFANDDLDAIDVWLAARMGELRHAEAKLAQREAKMAQASAGLAKLFEGIKHQVIQAEHARAAITETHHNAVKWFEHVAQTNNGRLDSVEASWAQRIAKLEQVDAQVDEWVHDIEEHAAALVKPVQERIERTVADMNTLVLEAIAKSEGAIQQSIDTAVQQAVAQADEVIEKRAREIADGVLAGMQKSIEEQVGITTKRAVDAAMSKSRQQVDDALSAQRDVMHAEVDDLLATTESMLAHLKSDAMKVRDVINGEADRTSDIAQQLQDAVDKQVQRVVDQMEEVKAAVEEHADELMASSNDWRERSEQACAAILDHTREAEQAAKMRSKQVLEGLQAQIEETVADAEARVHALHESVAKSTESAIGAAKQRVAEQTASMRSTANTAAEPVIAELNERIAMFREQASTLSADVEASVSSQIKNLQSAAAEAEGRMRTLRDATVKSTDHAIEAARERVSEHMGQLRASATSAAEPVMAELTERIATFRQQMHTMMADLDATMSSKLQSLHDDAAAQQSGRVESLRRDLELHLQQTQTSVEKHLEAFKESAADIVTQIDMEAAKRIRTLGVDGEAQVRSVLQPIAQMVADEIDAATEAAALHKDELIKQVRTTAAEDLRRVRKTLGKALDHTRRAGSSLATQADASLNVAEAKLQEHINSMSRQADEAAAALEQAIADRTSRLMPDKDATIADAEKALATCEAQMVDRAQKIASRVDATLTETGEVLDEKQNTLMARAAALKPYIEASVIDAEEVLAVRRESIDSGMDELDSTIDAAAEKAAVRLKGKCKDLQSKAGEFIKALDSDLDRKLDAMRERCDGAVEHAAQQRDAAEAIIAKISQSKLDVSPELVQQLDDAASVGRTLVARLEAQTRKSAEVAARMESLTRIVARLGEPDPDADTVDLEAGTPLWLENAERMLHELEKSLTTSKRTLSALEEARQSLDLQRVEPVRDSQPAAAPYVPVVGDEDEPAAQRDGGTSLTEAMMIVAAQSAGTTVKQEVLDAAVRSVESVSQLARDVAETGNAPEVMIARPVRGDKTAIDRYAEDLRRRIEEARKAR